MGGFINKNTQSIVYADNVDFSGAQFPSNTVTQDGELLIGGSASPHIAPALLTSTLGTITPTFGQNSINLDSALTISGDSGSTISPNADVKFTGGAGVTVATTTAPSNVVTISLAGGGLAIDTIHPDSGTDPVVPTAAGLVNIVGSGSTTTVGSLNTLTVQLTGLTNHAVLVGAGTTTITKVGPTATTGQVLQSAGAAADPAFSTATYPLTTTVSEILYSSATNTVTGLATANRGVLTTGATGVPAITALATNGQLIIGSTAGAPAAATLTAGAGVAITNGSNSITIDVATGGFTWVNVTGTSDTLVKQKGFQANNAGLVTLTMPTVGSSTFGDTIKVAGLGAGGWLIQCVATQIIHFGSSATSAAGSIASTNRYDSIELVCSSTTNEWLVVPGAVGNLTVI